MFTQDKEKAPQGNPVPENYPMTLQEIQTEMPQWSSNDWETKILKNNTDDELHKGPNNLVNNRILNLDKQGNVVVIPDKKFLERYRKNSIGIWRKELALSVMHNPPDEWHRDGRTNGYADDDLVNSYMLLLSRNVPNFLANTSNDIDFIVKKSTVGVRGFINGFAKFLFTNSKALFQKKRNGTLWIKHREKPTGKKLLKERLPHQMRVKLLNKKLSFTEEETKHLNLPDEAYIKIKTQAGNRYYFKIQEEVLPTHRVVVFPKHKPEDYHWALVVINFEKFTIEHYDSMYVGLEKKVFTMVLEYIKTSFENIYNMDSSEYMKQWKFVDYSKWKPKVTPLQRGVDCGFFVMEMAKYIAFNWKITKNKPNKLDFVKIRRRCIYELHQYCLLKI